MTEKTPIIHWGGGAAYRSGPKGRGVTFKGRGYPVCCSGDRARSIRDSGWMRFREECAAEVTCKTCLEIMKKRRDPGPDATMGIPELPGYPKLND